MHEIQKQLKQFFCWKSVKQPFTSVWKQMDLLGRRCAPLLFSEMSVIINCGYSLCIENNCVATKCWYVCGEQVSVIACMFVAGLLKM